MKNFTAQIKKGVKPSVHVGFLLVIAMFNHAMAASVAEGEAIFIQHGINDDIPRLGLSSLTQGEQLVEHVNRRIELAGNVRESEIFLIQNTDAKGNIDLRIKYDEDKLAESEDVITEIETITRTEYQLRDYVQSYDPKSVEAQKIDEEHTEISFNYSKYGLPQEIAYFRFMNVKIIVKNKQPVSMTINNSQPFNYGSYNVTNYKQTITFKKLLTGKIIIGRKHIEATGKLKRKKPFTLTMTTTPISYYDEDGETNVLNEAYLKQVSDPRMLEKQVTVHGFFPLMGDMVRRKGIDIPKAYGISIASRSQDMNFGFTDFNVMGTDLNDIFNAAGSTASVTAESFTVRGDLNILPFWNVYGLFGTINVDAKIDAQYTGAIGQGIKDKLNDKLTGLGDAFCDEISALCSQAQFGVPIHLEYDVVGLGTTLSAGYQEYFASVSATYSQTRLKGTDTWGDGILSIQPMLGYQLVNYRTQLFIGAEYQGLKPRFTGELEGTDINGETFSYDVGVNLNKWAFLVGLNKQFGKNYNVTLLLNKGETRSSATLNLGYRF
jgi:hypothetical protein